MTAHFVLPFGKAPFPQPLTKKRAKKHDGKPPHERRNYKSRPSPSLTYRPTLPGRSPLARGQQEGQGKTSPPGPDGKKVQKKGWKGFYPAPRGKKKKTL